MVPRVRASSLKWGTVKSYNESVSDRKLLVLNTHTFHSLTSHGSLITLSEESQKRNARSFLFLCAERERSELCDSAFLLERIFKWHLLSLNNNEIQHKPRKQTEKPQECSWTLCPWLTRASFMLQPLSCVNVLHLETSMCVCLVCYDEKCLFTFNLDWKSKKDWILWRSYRPVSVIALSHIYWV